MKFIYGGIAIVAMSVGAGVSDCLAENVTTGSGRLFDAVVAADGSGDFTSVGQAVAAAPDSLTSPWLIFIKNGEYREHVEIPISKPYLHLIGEDREKVVIADSLLSGKGRHKPDKGATVVGLADNLYFEGISFVNLHGYKTKNKPQALALNTQGDRIAMKNVKMLSFQDTWITTSDHNNRHYVTDSWIEGAVDFIYNSGNVFVENSVINIVRPKGGYITAPRHYDDTRWGYVFVNNRITAPGNPADTYVWLGRPWHDSPKTVFINTVAECVIPPEGWIEKMNGLPVLWADYNTIDAEGNRLDLSKRRDTFYYVDKNGEKVFGKSKNYLTAEEAAVYTVENVMSGDDGWDPREICRSCETPRIKVKGNRIEWQSVDGAIGYVVSVDGNACHLLTENNCEFKKGSTYTVRSVSRNGALSPKAVLR